MHNGEPAREAAGSYQRVLAVAIAAAQEAGTLLREDFLRPGGPVGAGHHAEADTHAETIICRRLLDATPDWAYLGEETGTGGSAGAEHLWLVDPNDGTAAYLKGFRGSAVSIGLLRNGVPVLGVVYAFAAPDNTGDLFTWAEGCGPLLHNGAIVSRAAWQATLTATTVVLVSQSADTAPSANLACVAPGRYRAEASIAYRLALVAAGEAEAGVSLNAPGGWDYAAGHALLRAVGGELVNERGTAVTYGVDGASSTTRCFGGAPEIVRILAQQPWNSVFGQHHTVELLDLLWPVHGRVLADDAVLQRAQGCLLGQFSGDALGSMVEFKTMTSIRQLFPDDLHMLGPSSVWNTLAGQPTDDSELALTLARTLLTAPQFDTEAIAASYLYWLQGRPFDIGGTTRRALSAIRVAHEHGTSLVAAASAAASQTSEANGALMRQSPLAIWGYAHAPDTLDACVRADTRLTHPNQVCQDASAAFIVSLAAIIREGLSAEDAYARALAWDAQHGASPSVTIALEAARGAVPEDFSHNQGHVLLALQNAWYQALHAPSFEGGVVATVMQGGDTDTNAAIAGALLGALHGTHAIPAQWRQAVLTCRPQQGASAVARPRPRAFWPVDALRVAEYLALAGAEAAHAVI